MLGRVVNSENQKGKKQKVCHCIATDMLFFSVTDVTSIKFSQNYDTFIDQSALQESRWAQQMTQNTFITDRVRSTREGYILTRVCSSMILSVHTYGGGTPARSRQGGTPARSSQGGTPTGRYPTLGPPVRPGRGTTP